MLNTLLVKIIGSVIFYSDIYFSIYLTKKLIDKSQI